MHENANIAETVGEHLYQRFQFASFHLCGVASWCVFIRFFADNQKSDVRGSETWVKLAKNTVLAELLREKNTVPAKKRSRTSHF